MLKKLRKWDFFISIGYIPFWMMIFLILWVLLTVLQYTNTESLNFITKILFSDQANVVYDILAGFIFVWYFGINVVNILNKQNYKQAIFFLIVVLGFTIPWFLSGVPDSSGIYNLGIIFQLLMFPIYPVYHAIVASMEYKKVQVVKAN